MLPQILHFTTTYSIEFTYHSALGPDKAMRGPPFPAGHVRRFFKCSVSCVISSIWGKSLIFVTVYVIDLRPKPFREFARLRHLPLKSKTRIAQFHFFFLRNFKLVS